MSADGDERADYAHGYELSRLVMRATPRARAVCMDAVLRLGGYDRSLLLRAPVLPIPCVGDSEDGS